LLTAQSAAFAHHIFPSLTLALSVTTAIPVNVFTISWTSFGNSLASRNSILIHHKPLVIAARSLNILIVKVNFKVNLFKGENLFVLLVTLAVHVNEIAQTPLTVAKSVVVWSVVELLVFRTRITRDSDLMAFSLVESFHRRCAFPHSDNR
jgi:hypothetical protein